nr:type I restriction endonuclease subunit R [Deinococcus seoulensis]
MTTPAARPSDYLEDLVSILPAVQLMQNLGYTYLTPADTVRLRGGKRGRVVLTEVLREQLAKLNSFEFRGARHAFSPVNIDRAVDAIAAMPYEALLTTAEKQHDLLTLGIGLEETVDGYTRSFQLQYVDWERPERNAYHVTDEFEVERQRSTSTRRPDVVVFVNGLPLVVIECKRPDIKLAVKEAISQHLRNQKPGEIPELFTTAQLLFAVAQNAAQYATTATPAKYWSVWKEEGDHEKELLDLVNRPLSNKQKEKMFSEREGWLRVRAEELWAAGQRLPTAQDRLLHGLLRPERLLEFVRGYVLFDGKIKKVARHQQFFAIKATVNRVKTLRADGSRQGGVVWHTTGSGKSLTMVMLGKTIALDRELPHPKIVLVTDRVDLDKQIHRTFKATGKSVARAGSGKHLLELLSGKAAEKPDVITTIGKKFESLTREKFIFDARDVFVLVDESHRSQYGKTAALMENVLPRACYIGFTGTPLLKAQKSTAAKYGGFIHTYTMRQAVEDEAVVPLRYEGRMSELRGDQVNLDKWFDRITKGLTDPQKADLKRRFQREEELLNAEQRMAEVAYDIGQHFKLHFAGTPFKGQFAVSSKAAALKYKKLFEGFGDVRVEVVISAPDTRGEHETVDDEDTPEVQVFWKGVMAKYGSEEAYLDGVISAFDSDDGPDILIVVDKLLTGFDVPRNAVLYLDKRLREHNILQAIARVNRLYDGKDAGLVVDYRGVFGALNEALDTYAALEAQGFDREDIDGSLTDVKEEIAKLASRHADVWRVFNGVENKRDSEAMQQHLGLQDVREEFYRTLTAFAKTLQLALGHAPWHSDTPEERQRTYTNDLKFFLNLRAAVKQRYGESVDYSAFEAQLRNLVNRYVGAEEVKTIVEPVSIFNVPSFEQELDEIEGEAAKADAIASRVKRTLTERMEEDPALYKRLGQMIEEAIEEHRARRLSDAEYLQRMLDLLDTTRNSGASGGPNTLQGREEARAYYGVLKEHLELPDERLAKLAIDMELTLAARKIRDWTTDPDVHKAMLNDLDDLLYALKKEDVNLDFKQMDEITHQVLGVAQARER